MVFKKINKRGTFTLIGLVVSLLIVIGIFLGCYLYLDFNVDSAGLTMDSKYSEMYSNLTASQEDLETNVQAIKGNLENVTQSEETWQQVWNGLKGLGNTLKLPITFVNTALSVWDSLITGTDIVPGWVIPLVFTGILAAIVFLVLSILKGEPKVS